MRGTLKRAECMTEVFSSVNECVRVTNYSSEGIINPNGAKPGTFVHTKTIRSCLDFEPASPRTWSDHFTTLCHPAVNHPQ